MNTLGEQYKAGWARLTNGQAQPPKEGLLFKTHNLPLQLEYEQLLRDSLEAVVKKAKFDIATGIAANLYGDEVLAVCSYIPRMEACYGSFEKTVWQLRGSDELLGNPERYRELSAYTSEAKQVVADIWHPFLNWLKEQGLQLHLSILSEAYGIREFIQLTVYVPEAEADTREMFAA